MSVLRLALLLLALAVAASAQSAAPTCPDYSSPNGCVSCLSGGIVGNFSVPKLPPLCAFDKDCPFDGVVMVGGLQVRVKPTNTSFECCRACKKAKNCALWQSIQTRRLNICYMYPAGSSGPVCGAQYETRVGAKCPPFARDDPHFQGAQGTHYDFGGQPGRSFCLLSDRRLHVNMKMTGYLDTRADAVREEGEGEGEAEGGKVQQQGQVRTWIRELGLLWTEAGGARHSLLLAARAGPGAARGAEGFLALAEADGNTLPRLRVGEEAALPGGLAIRFAAIKKRGSMEVDCYTVRIDGLLDLALELRPAHPLLQRPEDAQVHISVAINWIQTTAAIHGVLGQTYREGREERNAKFERLSAALKRPIVADGGGRWRGFLDGAAPADYVSSDVLQPDCRYSAFEGRALRAAAE